MGDKDVEYELKRIKGLSLTQTNPYVITDTNTHSNLNGYAIYAIEDTTFTAATTVFGVQGTGSAALAAKTLKAGHVWYIPVHQVDLAAGSVIVYRY